MEEPQALYALAVRFRQIATTMSDPDTISALRKKAIECDQQADAIERRRRPRSTR